MVKRTTGAITQANRLAEAWITLDAGPVIRTPARLGNHFRVRLTENCILEPPEEPHAGQRIVWRFEQPAAGGIVVTPTSSKFNTRGSLPVIADATASAVTLVEAFYDDVAGTWDVFGGADVSSLYQPLDATLTGIAALTGADGAGIVGTGVDTFEAFTLSNYTRTLYTQTADKTIANTTDATSINGTAAGSLTIPSALIRAGMTIHERHLGKYSTTVPSGDVTVDVQVGGVSLGSITVTPPNSITDFRIRIDVQRCIRATGAGGLMIVEALVQLESAHAGAGDTLLSFAVIGSETGVDWTSNSAELDVIWTWATADADNTVTFAVAYIIAMN